MLDQNNAKNFNTAFVTYLKDFYVEEDDDGNHLCTITMKGDDLEFAMQFCAEEHPEIDAIKWKQPYILEIHSLNTTSSANGDKPL